MAVKEKKPGLDLKAQLKLVDAPHPDEHWEGVWTFRDVDPDNEYSLHATVRLRFAAGLVEGRGAMSDEGEHVLDADISGDAAAENLTFATFVGNDEGVNGCLNCTATLTDARSRMSGAFTHACFNAELCEPDCEGGWGEFEMQRIVNQS